MRVSGTAAVRGPPCPLKQHSAGPPACFPQIRCNTHSIYIINPPDERCIRPAFYKSSTAALLRAAAAAAAASLWFQRVEMCLSTGEVAAGVRAQDLNVLQGREEKKNRQHASESPPSCSSVLATASSRSAVTNSSWPPANGINKSLANIYRTRGLRGNRSQSIGRWKVLQWPCFR